MFSIVELASLGWISLVSETLARELWKLQLDAMSEEELKHEIERLLKEMHGK